MEFIVSRSELKTKLDIIMGAVPSIYTHPILAHIKFTVKEDELSITGFDLAFALVAKMPIDLESGPCFMFTLPAKEFKTIVNKVNSKYLEFEVTQDSESDNIYAKIKSNKTTCNLIGHLGTEYPEIPTVESATENEGTTITEIPLPILLNGLLSTIKICKESNLDVNEEPRQILTCVNVKKRADVYYLAATDGHRLAVYHSPYEIDKDNEDQVNDDHHYHDNETNEFQFNLGKNVINTILKVSKIADNLKELIPFKLSENHVSLGLGDFEITSNNMTMPFPMYERLIPNQFTKKITIDNMQILEALKIVSALTDKHNNIIKFDFDFNTGIVTLSHNSTGLGQISGKVDILNTDFYEEDGTESEQNTDFYEEDGTESEQNTDIFSVGFNSKYIRDHVEIFKTVNKEKEMVFSMNKKTQPLITKTDVCTLLLMPLDLDKR